MKINIKISGITPLLMHKFNEDHLTPNKASNKNLTPREIADQFAYKDEMGRLYFPGNNVFSCIVDAGKFFKSGKNKITTVRSSLIPAFCSIGQEVIYFEQKDYEVDSRSCVNPSTGGRIMTHRPRLDSWSLMFDIIVDEFNINERLLREIVDAAGVRCGLGSYRPNRKGTYGKFKVVEWKIVK